MLCDQEIKMKKMVVSGVFFVFLNLAYIDILVSIIGFHSILSSKISIKSYIITKRWK